MSDRGSGELQLRPAWQALTKRLAVAAGSLAALISLLHHAPASIASLRGGVAWIVVLTVSRAGLFALERSIAFDRAAQRRDGDAGR